MTEEPVRTTDFVLARLERRTLQRLAAALPAWMVPDHLTLIGIFGSTLVGAGYLLSNRNEDWLLLACLGLAINWFGDSLDGTVARVRGTERPRYGFYVDHVVDIVGITMLMGGLAASGFMTPLIAMAVLIGYLLVSGEVFLATAVRGVFKMSFAGVGPTELRILLAIGTLALFSDPHVNVGSFGRVQLFDFGGLVAAAGLGVTLLVGFSRNALALARLEPRQRPGA